MSFKCLKSASSPFPTCTPGPGCWAWWLRRGGRVQTSSPGPPGLVCTAARPPRTSPARRTGSPGCGASWGGPGSRSRPAGLPPLRSAGLWDRREEIKTPSCQSVMGTLIIQQMVFSSPTPCLRKPRRLGLLAFAAMFANYPTTQPTLLARPNPRWRV